MKNNNYYVIQSEEDKEFEVLNSLKKMFKEDTFFIPLSKDKILKNGITFWFYIRTMPDYIVWETSKEPDLHSCLKVTSTNSVLSLLSESTNKGMSPASVSQEEIKKFLKSRKYNEEINNMKESTDCLTIGESYNSQKFKLKRIVSDNVVVENGPDSTLEIKIWDLAFNIKG